MSLTEIQNEQKEAIITKAYSYLPQIPGIILRTIWWSTENNIRKFWTNYGPLQGWDDANVS
jgi:hypothetical protein